MNKLERHDSERLSGHKRKTVRISAAAGIATFGATDLVVWDVLRVEAGVSAKGCIITAAIIGLMAGQAVVIHILRRH